MVDAVLNVWEGEKMSDKPRKGNKASKRLAGRIKDYDTIKQDSEGEFTKPGSYKK